MIFGIGFFSRKMREPTRIRLLTLDNDNVNLMLMMRMSFFAQPNKLFSFIISRFVGTHLLGGISVYMLSSAVFIIFKSIDFFEGPTHPSHMLL
jgi:hypothetical protein